MTQLLTTHSYTPADQRAFAELSGDFNPLHLDDVYARREFFGQVVVHGMHALLHALDAFAATRKDPQSLAGLQVRFLEPLYLHEESETRQTHCEERDGQTDVRMRVLTGGTVVQEIALVTRRRDDPARPDVALPPYPWRTKPPMPSFEHLIHAAGNIPLLAQPAELHKRFPNLAAVFPPRTVAALLALTRLVGMECPGLRSVLAGLSLQRSHAVGTTSNRELHWRVTLADERFSKLRIAVRTDGLSGLLETFYRPQPVPQPTFAEVAARVTKDEFQGRRALIIGGSRGLGEVTAKIIAAGGGHPTITYHRGRDDARRVAAQMHAAGAACDIQPCDVHGPLPSLPRPTDLFYFATPKIFVRRRSEYDDALYDRFTACYVEGFRRTLAACGATDGGRVNVFYPSSVAVHENRVEHAEYAAAKQDGERACAELAQANPNLSILVRRLPRIATDQTTTYVPYPAAAALDVMLDIARQMDGRSAAHPSAA